MAGTYYVPKVWRSSNEQYSSCYPENHGWEQNERRKKLTCLVVLGNRPLHDLWRSVIFQLVMFFDTNSTSTPSKHRSLRFPWLLTPFVWFRLQNLLLLWGAAVAHLPYLLYPESYRRFPVQLEIVPRYLFVRSYAEPFPQKRLGHTCQLLIMLSPHNSQTVCHSKRWSSINTKSNKNGKNR